MSVTVKLLNESDNPKDYDGHLVMSCYEHEKTRLRQLWRFSFRNSYRYAVRVSYFGQDKLEMLVSWTATTPDLAATSAGLGLLNPRPIPME